MYDPAGRGTRMSSTSTRTSCCFFFVSSTGSGPRSWNHESNTVSVFPCCFIFLITTTATALVLPSCPTAPDLWPRLNYECFVAFLKTCFFFPTVFRSLAAIVLPLYELEAYDLFLCFLKISPIFEINFSKTTIVSRAVLFRDK